MKSNCEAKTSKQNNNTAGEEGQRKRHVWKGKDDAVAENKLWNCLVSSEGCSAVGIQSIFGSGEGVVQPWDTMHGHSIEHIHQDTLHKTTQLQNKHEAE